MYLLHVVCYCVFTTLFVLHVLCFIVSVNCLLNAFVICLGVVVVFLLNVMVLFCAWVSFLLSSPCMSFHSVCYVCGSIVCLYVLFRCLFFLFLCMWCLIYCMICSGNNLHALCILSFGVWCLSACKIMLMSVVLSVCGLVGVIAFLKTATDEKNEIEAIFNECLMLKFNCCKVFIKIQM